MDALAVRNLFILLGVFIGGLTIALDFPWVVWRPTLVGVTILVTAAVYGWLMRRRIS